MASKKHKTREQWLLAGLELVKPEFTRIGQKVPKRIRVSCGFPSKNPLGNKKRRIGECWADKASKGKFFEIFISPTLDKPFDVLDTLVHEVVHAVVGLECGHKGEFRKVAKAVGLTGKMSQASAGPELKERLYALLNELGDYPHDELSKMTNGRKKDTCRLLKAECPGCGYVIRVTRKWMEKAGLPTCPCGEEFTSDA